MRDVLKCLLWGVGALLIVFQRQAVFAEEVNVDGSTPVFSTVEVLFQNLEAKKWTLDVSKLRKVQAKLEAENHTRSQQVGVFTDLLETCAQAFPELLDICQEDAMSSEPLAFREYIGRLYINLALERIEREQLNPIEIFEQLGQIDFKEFHTPKTHEVVLRAVMQLSNVDKPEARQKALKQEPKELLVFFSAQNKEISYWYARLLTRAAKDAVLAGDKSLAVVYVKESLSISSEEFDQRTEVMKALDMEVPVSGNVAEDVWVRPKAPKSAEEKARVIIVISMVGIFVVFFIWLFLLRQKRVQAEEMQYQHMQSAGQKGELRALLKYFGLDIGADMDALTHAFRQMAKKHHPDTSSANAEDFTRLKVRYERARKLLETHSGGE